MLPRITISPDISKPSLRSTTSSRPSSANELRSKKSIRPPSLCGSSRPPSAAGRQLVSVPPARRSLDGLKAVDASLQDLALQSSIYSFSTGTGGSSSSSDIQQAANNVEATVDDHDQIITRSSSKTSLKFSASSCSLTSDADLALLLGGAEVEAPAGTTIINVGSIPLFVPVCCVDVNKAAGSKTACEESVLPAGEPPETPQMSQQGFLLEAASEAQHLESKASSSSTSTKLKATSAEFYPKAYLAAAAAAATAFAAASSSSIGSSQQEQQQPPVSDLRPLAAIDDVQHDVHLEHAQPAEQQLCQYQHQQQEQQEPCWLPHHLQHQEYVPAEQPQSQQQQQQPAYLQHWQHWPQLQQVAAVPVFFPVPVPVPPFMLPVYPYAYPQHQQVPAAPEQQYRHATALLPAEEQQHPAISPAATAVTVLQPVSPAASTVLEVSTLSPAPSTTQDWSLLDSSSGRYVDSSSRPGSSASSMASGYSSYRGSSGSGWQQQQQGPREGGSTVSVSPMSNVKDAAGALAKVASRNGGCLLLALARTGDQVAHVTHVAAKSLAVARFYLNSGMSAEGPAGVEAAAHLTGLEPGAPSEAAPPAGAAVVEDELIFMPYYKSSSGCSAAVASSSEPVINFLVAKAAAADLPAQLPPPVGIPACMQDRQQPAVAATAAGSSNSNSRSQLLRAGATTDVNKLSNAIIHNILDQGHVALQLAGATACQIAMKSLVKAGSRLQKKFSSDIVATASFANLDTSSSIGRSTVFLRVDVMRSSLLRQLAAAGAAAGDTLSRQVSGALEAVRAQPQQQQQQQLVPC